MRGDNPVADKWTLGAVTRALMNPNHVPIQPQTVDEAT